MLYEVITRENVGLDRLALRLGVDQRDLERRPAVGEAARIEDTELDREQQRVDRKRCDERIGDHRALGRRPDETAGPVRDRVARAGGGLREGLAGAARFAPALAFARVRVRQRP